jgi:hypothetical protein
MRDDSRGANRIVGIRRARPPEPFVTMKVEPGAAPTVDGPVSAR